MFCLMLVSVFASDVLSQDATGDPVPTNPTPRWWRGNLHTHSLWSDGDDFPEMIAEWYRTHHYNFLALTDHNILAQGMKWMKLSAIERRSPGDALATYRQRFGSGWVETRGGGEALEVRLKPLHEFRHLVEERGKFILIPAEEISDRAEGKPVHMNATNVQEVVRPMGGQTVREAIRNNFRAVEEQSKKLGREILLHLNHPNFGWAVTAEDIALITEERFFEVYNGHPGVRHLGDETRPGVEKMWDIANAIRLSQLNAAPLLGIATDDSHDYFDTDEMQGSHVGRGWVMVRSSYLTPEHLIKAMRRGDFYASSGVELNDLSYDADSRTLRAEVKQPEADESFVWELIGTPIPVEKDMLPEAEEIGKTIQRIDGGKVFEAQIPANLLYARLVVTSNKSADDPSFKGQKKQAWTQPVGWKVEE